MTTIAADTWMARLQNLGIHKVEVLLLADIDVTYYFDRPLTRDPKAPYSSREFLGETGDTMRAFEAWLREERTAAEDV